MLKEQEALIKKVNINPESCKVSFSRKSKRSSIICGRNILTDPIPISEVNLDLDVATIEGEIISLESRELKNGETLLVILAVTDYTSTITCKMFLRYRRNGQDNNHESPSISPAEKARVEKIVNMLSEGSFVKIRGRCVYDTYADEVSLMIQDIIAVKKEERLDTAPLKRVELHMHTHMSAMDALSSPEVLIERAASWGHTAVAITDHGVLQAFPAAFSAAKKHSIKLLPGLEAYMIKENIVVENCKNISLNKPIVVIDFETTGLNTKTDKIIEIGAVKLDGDKIVETFSELINPHISLPSKITKITGITDAMLNGKPSIEQVMPDFLKFVGNCPIAAHNASFDMGMLESELERQSITLDVAQIDTLALSRKLYPMLKSHRLKSLCRHLNVSLQNAHRAFDDARATAQCLSKMIEEVERLGACTLPEIDQLIQGGVIGQRFHIILLAITQKGLTNLNRLVSDAHINHFQKFPHLPRTLIEKYREGLLIGSACEAGELYQAVLNKQPDSELEKIAGFYDYLEIQPTSNNAFLIKNGMVTSEKELEEHNKKIVSLGSLLDIPVVATGDVHFLDPKDAIGRSIIQSGLGYSDSDEQPPLYFKTTQEMLKDFAYLGEEKAKEVVITNTQKIAARAEDLSLFPIHPEGKSTFQPLWTDAADKIKTMSVKRAKDIYGQNLPDIVDTRLNKELKSIIGNGFATLYMIAHKLALKSLQDGYVVGSRGSVGSSFVATMCDITEVNPLGPHYVCTNCKYSDFDVDKKAFKVGVDLPDKLCPNCSTMLHKEGFDIPFEVFLGFKGDKVPDIDLNFPSSYQPIAHTFVENLFPKGHVYRA
ncbi:MAG TPA: PolC-type DNA polymerase III, partial [Clostridia bacterium]|nr:PolC-type DNA polymerase III [Clostridia bacterium]